MIKNILKPGNGIDFPSKGDFVVINLFIYTHKNIVLFDTSKTKKNGFEIRYNCKESNLIKELEELIGEMSLFEKCSLEIQYIPKSKQNVSNLIENLLSVHKNLIFEVEIIEINKFSQHN